MLTRMVLGFVVVITSNAAIADEAALPERENFHLFLLAGQSNMAGRGEVSEEDKVAHPRVLMHTQEGTWAPAVDPIHYDKTVAGVGLGRSFAIAIADANPEVTIGLIPAACGGSPISAWQPGGYWEQTKSHPYDDAVARTRRALEDGVLKGVLWHQGESDSGTLLKAQGYETSLRRLIERFRIIFDAPELPFVIGQLGNTPENPWNDGRHRVDAAQQAVAAKDDRAAFVSAEGLSMKDDNIHFDARSLRIFGQRYADAYLKLVGE